jgi:hypothetical protein
MASVASPDASRLESAHPIPTVPTVTSVARLAVTLRCHCHREQERRLNQVAPITAAPHLRLVWPQWQGAGTESVRSLAPEFPFDIARRGYSVGTKVLQAVLPEHDGPTAIVPVEMGDIGLEERDGIEAKAVVLQQLRSGWRSSKNTNLRASPRLAASAR